MAGIRDSHKQPECVFAENKPSRMRVGGGPRWITEDPWMLERFYFASFGADRGLASMQALVSFPVFPPTAGQKDQSETPQGYATPTERIYHLPLNMPPLHWMCHPSNEQCPQLNIYTTPSGALQQRNTWPWVQISRCCFHQTFFPDQFCLSGNEWLWGPRKFFEEEPKPFCLNENKQSPERLSPTYEGQFSSLKRWHAMTIIIYWQMLFEKKKAQQK